MWNSKPDAEKQALDWETLRVLAERKLAPAAAPEPVLARTADALAVLYRLAGQPDSAVDALKLLHELQVHQVELELQHEEIERSRAELTASRDRYARFYASAPMAYLSVGHDRTILEANLAAGALLGADHRMLRGRRLTDFMTSASRPPLGDALGAVLQGLRHEVCTLDLLSQTPPSRRVRMEAVADPAGHSFLVVLSEIHPATDAPAP